MAKWLKRAGITLGVILAVLLALVLLVLLFVQLPGGKDVIRDRVESTLEDSLEGEVDIGSIEGNLVTSATLRDIRIYDDRGNLAVRIPVVRADYSAAGLLGGELRVDSLTVERPLVLAHMYEDGTLNLSTIPVDEPPADAAPPSDFRVILQEATVQGGEAVYLDEAAVDALDDEHRAQIERWLGDIDDPEADPAELGERIAEVLDANLGDEMAGAALHEIDLTGSFGVRGGGRTTGRLERLRAAALTSATSGRHDLAVDDVDFEQSPDSLEVALASARAESLAELSELSTAVDLETERNEQGAQIAVGLDEFSVELERLVVEPRLIDALAPDAPVTGQLTTSARITGTETAANYAIDLGCGTEPNVQLTGDVDFPARSFEEARYTLDAEFDDLQPSACAAIDGPEVTTSGSLEVDGERFEPEELAADASLRLSETTIDDYRIETLEGDFSARRGDFEVESLRALTPYGLLEAGGSYDLGGEYAVEVDVDANEEVRRLLDDIDGEELQTDFAHIRLKSDGRIDPDGDEAFDILERADASVEWRLRGVGIEEYAIAQSTADASASLEPVGDGEDERRVNYDLDLNGQSVDLPQFNARAIDIDATGDGRLDPPLEEPLAALARLSTDWSAEVTGLDTPEATVRSADLSGELRRGGTRRPFSWNVEGRLDGVRYTEYRLESALLDLAGDAEVEAVDDTYEVGKISARGDAQLGPLDAAGVRASGADVDLDVGGSADKPTGTVAVDGRDIEVADEEIEALSARADIDEAGDFAVDVRADREVPLTLEAAGRVDDAYRNIDLDRFSFGSPDIDLRLRRPSRIALLDDGVRFSDLELDSDGQRLGVDGTLRSTGRQDARIDLEDFRPGLWREELGLEEMIPSVRGSIDATASIEGPARWPDVDAQLTANDFHYEEYGPFDTRLAVEYADQKLRVERLEASAYGEPILSGSGAIPLVLDAEGNASIPQGQQVQAEVTVPQLDLDAFYEAFPILEDYEARGTIGGGLEMSGTLRNPDLDTSLTARDLGWSGRVGGQMVEIDQITTKLGLAYEPPTGGEGGVTARWKLDWRGDDVVDASLSTPAPLADWVDRSLDRGQPIPDWRKEVSQLPFEVDVRVGALDLGDVPVETLAEADAEGEFNLDIRGSGTFSEPELAVDVGLDDFGWNQFRDVYVDAVLRVDEQALDIERLTTEWAGDEIVTASGEVPLPTRTIIDGEPLRDLPIDLTAQLEALPLSKLSPIDYEFARYRGTMAAFVEIGGTLSDPALEGRMGLFDTQSADGDPATVAVGFEAGDDRVDLSAFACRRYEDVLTAQADLPINTDVLELAGGASPLADGQLDATIESDDLELADLVPANLFEEYVDELEGRLDLDAEVGGTWEEPYALGEVRLSDGAVTLPYYGRRFTDIDLDLDVSREQVELAELNLREGDTSLGAEGVVALDRMRPGRVDARFQSDSFNLGGFVDGYDAYVTSEVVIDGDLGEDPGRVHAHAESLEISLPETTGDDLHATELDEEIIVLRRTQTPETLFEDGALTEGTDEEEDGAERWMVRFTAERDSWVRHPNGDVEFTTDVTTELGGPEVSMVGAVNTVRGDFEFLGKRFEVPEQENAVRFTGASPPNPQLDVRAIFPVDRSIVQEMGDPTEGDPRIIVQVRGTAEEPRLILESDPAMTETEIVYVLMTNRAPNQADAGEESRVSGLALGAASGIFAGMLQQRLASTLPLDVIRVEAGEEGFRDARLQLGTYLTETIFVSYSYRFGAEEDEPQNIGKIEYRFAPRWSLETEYSDQLTGEFNIFWDVY